MSNWPRRRQVLTSRHTRKGKPELEKVSHQHKLLSDETVTPEDYTFIPEIKKYNKFHTPTIKIIYRYFT